MTALKTYKRKPAPTLYQHQAINPAEVITTYLAEELRQLENTLTIHGQATTSIEDGVTTIKQNIIDLNTTTGNNTAAITQEATVRSSADSALSTLVTNLSATVTSGDNTNAAAISSEATARANADSAVATTVSNLAATVTSGDNTNSAAISSEATARANADSALSSTVSSLTSTVNGVSASVTAEASARVAADNTLLAKYGVTLNSNGYITGFSQNNNGTTGSFKIIADEFKIINPNNASGQAGVEVFGVAGGYATIKNIRSAASGARLQIDSDLMSVYDASGVLRVKLGNLS
tara:strand:+ start:2063 stop:2941 length:879 start_codon:yes stop_codon:yes gene_type:complete